jgi:hydrogenase large subunit
LSTHNPEKFDPVNKVTGIPNWPAQAKGAGFIEAPRGALGHWVVIENGKIANKDPSKI